MSCGDFQWTVPPCVTVRCEALTGGAPLEWTVPVGVTTTRTVHLGGGDGGGGTGAAMSDERTLGPTVAYWEHQMAERDAVLAQHCATIDKQRAEIEQLTAARDVTFGDAAADAVAETRAALAESDDGPDGMLAYQLAIRTPDRNDPTWPLPSFDARDWAQSFCEIAAKNGHPGIDEGWMISWFANALMRGYDERAWRMSAESEQPTPATDTEKRVRAGEAMSDYMTEFGKLVAESLATSDDTRHPTLTVRCLRATLDKQRAEIERLTAERDALQACVDVDAHMAQDATDPGPALVAETRAAMADGGLHHGLQQQPAMSDCNFSFVHPGILTEGSHAVTSPADCDPRTTMSVDGGRPVSFSPSSDISSQIAAPLGGLKYGRWAREQSTAAAALPDVEQPKPGTDTEKRVNDVIDDLTARKVGDIDRFRLRGALDKADKPLEGREGADAGLGRAIGRSAREPFSIGW